MKFIWVVYFVGDAHDVEMCEFEERERALAWMDKHFPDPERAYIVKRCI